MKKYVILTEVKDRVSYTTHSEIRDEQGKAEHATTWGTKTEKALEKVVLNVDYIVSVRENHMLCNKIEQMPEGLDERHQFCRITLASGMNSRQVDVVGDLQSITKQIWGNVE